MEPTPRQRPSKDQWPDCQWLSLVALPQTTITAYSTVLSMGQQHTVGLFSRTFF